ncbi:MAG: YqiA/YcfP family alpha/beta fold hydrolase [Betaproteobacteria bacterium]
MTQLVYLHGFRSSSRGIKATLLRAAIDALPAARRPSLWVPDLPHRPAAAIALVAGHVEAAGDPAGTTFVGSSLGGYYATHLAERFGARAVLINPAIRPCDDLRPYRGVQVNLYSGESFEIGDAHFDELAALRVPRVTRPARYLLLVETGDEVLDYRAAVAFYAGAWQFVQGGGDHAYQGFAAQIAALLRFARTADHCEAQAS